MFRHKHSLGPPDAEAVATLLALSHDLQLSPPLLSAQYQRRLVHLTPSAFPGFFYPSTLTRLPYGHETGTYLGAHFTIDSLVIGAVTMYGDGQVEVDHLKWDIPTRKVWLHSDPKKAAEWLAKAIQLTIERLGGIMLSCMQLAVTWQDGFEDCAQSGGTGIGRRRRRHHPSSSSSSSNKKKSSSSSQSNSNSSKGKTNDSTSSLIVVPSSSEAVSSSSSMLSVLKHLQRACDKLHLNVKIVSILPKIVGDLMAHAYEQWDATTGQMMDDYGEDAPCLASISLETGKLCYLEKVNRLPVLEDDFGKREGRTELLAQANALHDHLPSPLWTGETVTVTDLVELNELDFALSTSDSRNFPILPTPPMTAFSTYSVHFPFEMKWEHTVRMDPYATLSTFARILVYLVATGQLLCKQVEQCPRDHQGVLKKLTSSTLTALEADSSGIHAALILSQLFGVSESRILERDRRLTREVCLLSIERVAATFAINVATAVSLLEQNQLIKLSSVNESPPPGQNEWDRVKEDCDRIVFEFTSRPGTGTGVDKMDYLEEEESPQSVPEMSTVILSEVEEEEEVLEDASVVGVVADTVKVKNMEGISMVLQEGGEAVKYPFDSLSRAHSKRNRRMNSNMTLNGAGVSQGGAGMGLERPTTAYTLMNGRPSSFTDTASQPTMIKNPVSRAGIIKEDAYDAVTIVVDGFFWMESEHFRNQTRRILKELVGVSKASRISIKAAIKESTHKARREQACTGAALITMLSVT